MRHKKIEVQCATCGKKFLRGVGEVNRNQKLNRKVYCTRRCVGLDNVNNLPKDTIGNIQYLQRRVVDEFSPFRQFLKSARQHRKVRDKSPPSITLSDLKAQWDRQKGICPYTGWQLDLERSKFGQTKPGQASLDRIDSSVGYESGNVQFIALVAQYAKSSWTEDILVAFCEAVATHRSMREIDG